MTDDVNVTLS